MKVYRYPDPSQVNELIARPSIGAKKLDATIAWAFNKIAQSGDAALRELTLEFDEVDIGDVVCSSKGIRSSAKRVEPNLKKAINQAAANIRKFHVAQLQITNKIETVPGVTCWQEARPIDKVGLYVPGGSAPLISTVLMLGIPAQIAGCKEVVLCTPPDQNGQVDPAICYAALACGITRIARVGGCQAIAAMSLGTESVPQVDKIFGPGNQYVVAAKNNAQKYGVAIDMPAGPSEVMVIADGAANPEFVAADLLSQAEHGPDSQVVLLSADTELINSVKIELKKQLLLLPRSDIARQALSKSFCVLLKSINEAFQFANEYAPEHLILNIDKPETWTGAISNAGSVFLGALSPESAGDYASGTNHTLPTNGWARSYSGVTVDSFQTKLSFQFLTEYGLRNISQTVETLAKAEGLDAHARAVSVRINAINLKRNSKRTI